MHVSFSMLNRILEQESEKNPQYRAQLRRSGPVLLSDGRKLSDEDLLAKLADLGIEITRERLDDLTSQFVSAQGLAVELVESCVPPVPEEQLDSVWIACTCLWERWFPERASTEMIDDRMQAGYEAREADRDEEACRLWLETWRGIRRIMEGCRIRSIEAFDEVFGGTQSLFNWIQDFEDLLDRAGYENAEFWQQRLALCELVVNQFEDLDPLMLGTFRRALAESHYDLGRAEEAQRLFERWLAEDPQWGCGWIGWADLYHEPAGDEALDSVRAEQLLLQALAVPDVRDREAILERLRRVYEDLDRDADAERIAAELRALRPRSGRWGVAAAPADSVTERMIAGDDHLSFRQTYEFGEEGLPLDQFAELGESLRRGEPPPARAAAGRNETCPCGSGKKYKKCCGKR